MNLERTRRPVPDDLFGGRLSSCFLLDLEVAAIVDRTPRLRSIRFRSTDLIGFEWQPGQDVMLTVPGADPVARRRYTIRRADADAGTLDIDVVLHGAGSFARWAAATTAGDRIAGIGPRGVITLRRDATHHLFVGDESAIAVSYAMAEALPAHASATVVLGTEAGLPFADPPDVDTVWLPVDGVIEALQSIALPDGTAAYVNGERGMVRHAVAVLGARGLDADAIAGKAYWRSDQPNADHGEPSKD